MKSQKKRKWTVFFVIKAVAGSISETIKMMNEIRVQELNSQISVVVCLNFIREHLDPLLKGDESFTPDPHEKGTLTTIFFKLIPGNNPDKFQSDLRIILERSTFDITDPNDIEEYFRDHVLRRYKAKHYLLFTWDHGKGYGIFEDSSVPNQKEDIEVIVQPEVKILTMEELRNAISLAFGTKKVDLVIMMNCLMQMVDTGYALRKNAKYLVAPQTDMDFRGYNYSFIFQAMINNPNIKPRKLAKLAVRSFASKAYINTSLGDNIKSKTSVFATDLSQFTTLGKQIDRLVYSVLPRLHSEDSLKAIQAIREKSMVNPATNLCDFYSFICNLRNEILFSDIQIASLLISVKELLVIESHVATKLTVPTTGLLIYFPDALQDPERPLPNFDEFFQTEFMKRTKWLSLVEKTI
jgi:hypothetical protein